MFFRTLVKGIILCLGIRSEIIKSEISRQFHARLVKILILFEPLGEENNEKLQIGKKTTKTEKGFK